MSPLPSPFLSFPSSLDLAPIWRRKPRDRQCEELGPLHFSRSLLCDLPDRRRSTLSTSPALSSVIFQIGAPFQISADRRSSSNNSDLQDHISWLPLDCLMMVMQLTSPKDACRFAAVCTTFQLVADSDYVWESFLPDDLSSILYRAKIDVQQLPVSKKELYLHLCCNWILLDGGTKSFRLDLLSGAKIVLLQKQYPSTKDLIQIPKGIKGAIHCKDLSPKMNYAAYLIFTRSHKSPYLRITQWIYDSSSGVNSINSMEMWQKKTQIREDGSREIKLGEFNTGVRLEDRAVHFVICDKYAIYVENDLNFLGIEARPVC